MTWSKEWPTEPGLYWFYGLRTITDVKPELYVIRAHQRGTKIVIEGVFAIAYQGWFQKIVPPELPD